MKDHAIFVSLTENYTYLFNALYNSAEYFGIGDYADFVVIHEELPNSYIKFMEEKTANLKTKVIFKKFTREDCDTNLGKVLSIKFYRYKIMSEMGKNYKSILFLDSDIFFVSGIKEFFEIAAKTDLVVCTNDQVTRVYRTDKNKGCCPAYVEGMKSFFEEETFDGKFVCNVPTFIDMNKYSHVFIDIFNHRCKLGQDNSWPFTGDLDTMNLVFTKNEMKQKMIILPAHLWTGVHYSIYRSNICVKRWNMGKHVKTTDDAYKSKFLFMSENHEHIRSFHGRDWASDKSEDALKNRSIPKLLGQMEGKFEDEEYKRALAKRASIFDLIQSVFLFFQFDSYINLDELVEVASIENNRYLYLKKRREKLNNTVRSFM